MNLSTVKWAQWDKTHSRELLGPFVCVCIALCAIVAHNIAQNRPDNFPSYPPHNHHCSDGLFEGRGSSKLDEFVYSAPAFHMTNQKCQSTEQNSFHGFAEFVETLSVDNYLHMRCSEEHTAKTYHMPSSWLLRYQPLQLSQWFCFHDLVKPDIPLDKVQLNIN